MGIGQGKLTKVQQGELNAAKVAGELNIPYCLSTAGSQPIEDVARVNGQGPRFFQVSLPNIFMLRSAERWSNHLYCPHDEELEDSLLKRAWVRCFIHFSHQLTTIRMAGLMSGMSI